jgi:chromosome segregation ATPase
MEQFTGGNMQEYLQKVVDYVAQLSTQASLVQGLQEQVSRMNERLNNLEQENAQLRRDLDQANGQINHVQSDLDNTTRNLDNERAVSQSLRDTIVQRDAGVVSLEQDLRSERDAHTVTTRERDEAKAENEDLRMLVEQLRHKLGEATQERDNLNKDMSEANREISDLRTRLDRVNSILNPPQPVTNVA